MANKAPIRSLYEHITDIARRHGDHLALIGCDESGNTREEITYAELALRLEAAQHYFYSLGVRRGDRVALAFKNSPELLILSWAAWASGIVTVPLDVKRDTPELCAYKINLNKATAFIVQKGALDSTPELEILATEFAGFPPRGAGDMAWEKDLSSLALILFTSGTTGHPKGAKLTLENLIVNADGIREWLRITAEDRFLVQLPLHHINSTTFTLSTLLAGGTIAIPPMYSNSRLWQQVGETGATITSIVQSILADQLEREEEFARMKSKIVLNRIQIGSAPVVAHSVQEFIKRFGIAIYQGYGQTETALRVTGVPMGLSQDLYKRLIEENSIGTPMSWADLQIADKDGRILGEGEEGELVIKGAAVMEGYVAGESAFRNGYFLTGDIGLYKTIDAKRFFYLKGRSREIIIKGGVNISPVAVENGLKKVTPDIAQAYCIGLLDDRYGEEVAAALVWRQGVDQQSAMRKLKSVLLAGTEALPAFETPRYLATLDADELPLTSTGKVQRTVLRTNVPRERFSSLFDLMKTSRYQFSILTLHSPLVAESHARHNHCWQPLSMDREQYA
ncbi:MAG TPA: class I adenylate-forming enzyme family protein, partial [Candidatus Paceibacterota bacterium]